MRNVFCALSLLSLAMLSGCGGGGGTSGTSGPVIVSPGSGAGAGEVVRTIQGRVLNGAGTPIAGAKVSLPSKSRQTLTTDANGQFTMSVRVAEALRSLTLDIVLPYGTASKSIIELPEGATALEPLIVAIADADPQAGNAAPVIATATVTPQTVDVSGGVVKLRVVASDAEVDPLIVVAAFSTGTEVTTSALTYSAGEFTSTVEVDANLGASETDRTFNVWFSVTDAPKGSCQSTNFGPVPLTLKGMPTPPSLPAGLD